MAKYRAFISYSHQEQDLARRLHARLETFVVPADASLAESGQALGAVFLDEAVLGAAHDLSEVIRHALDEAESLVLLASPTAARSRWVNEEIVYFRSRKPHAPCLAIIARGRPDAGDADEQCYPPGLRYKIIDGRVGAEAHDALGCDIVKDGEDVAFLKLVAGILQVDYEALSQRHKVREQDIRRKQRRAFAKTYAVAARQALDNNRPDNAIKYALAYLLEAGNLGHGAEDGAFDSHVLTWPEADDLALVACEAGAVLRQKIALTAHDGNISSLVLSPDGKSFATASGQVFDGTEFKKSDGAVSFRDLQTGAEIFRSVDGDNTIDLAFTPDGAHLLSLDDSGNIRFFAVPSGKLEKKVSIKSFIRKMWLSPDGKSMVLDGYFKNDPATLLVMETGTDKVTGRLELMSKLKIFLDRHAPISVLRLIYPVEGGREYCHGASFSPDGKTIAISTTGHLLLFDLKSGSARKKIKDHSASLLRFFDNGRHLVFGGTGFIKSMAVRTLSTTWEKMHGEQTSSLALAPAQRHIAFGSEDHNKIGVIDAADGTDIFELHGHERSVCCLSYSQDGRGLVSASRDGRVVVWDAAGHVGRIDIPYEIFLGVEKAGGYLRTERIKVASRTRWTQSRWDIRNGRKIDSVEVHYQDFKSGIRRFGNWPVCWSNAEDRYAHIKKKGGHCIVEIRMRDTGRLFRSFVVDIVRDAGVTVSFSTDDSWILVSNYQEIGIWSIDSGKCLHRLKVGKFALAEDICFVRPGKVALSATKDRVAFSGGVPGLVNRVVLWDLQSGRCEIHAAVFVTFMLDAPLFSPDGRYLAFAKDGASVEVIDVHQRSTVTLQGPQENVTAIAFAGRGTLFAATDGRDIRFWEMPSGRPAGRIHFSGAQQLEFALNDERLVANAKTGVHIFDIAHLHLTRGALTKWLCGKMLKGVGGMTAEDRADPLLDDVLGENEPRDFAAALVARYPALGSPLDK